MSELMPHSRIFAIRNFFEGGVIALHFSRIAHSTDGRAVRFAKPLEFSEPVAPLVHSDPEPFLHLDDTLAQSLMDQLWTCGVRPTEGAGTAGSMAAAQRHLEDMRAIVRKTLDVPLPDSRSNTNTSRTA